MNIGATKQTSTTRQITKGFFSGAGLFVLTLVLCPLLLLMLSVELYKNGVTLPSFFYGPAALEYAVGYTMAIGLAIGIILFVVGLSILAASRRLRFVMPWIVAGAVELVLAAIYIGDLKAHSMPTALGSRAAGIFQLLVLAPLVLGYAYYAARANSGRR